MNTDYLRSLPLEDGEADTLDYITNLSQVNLFIGANNSGKSRFLRSLFFSNQNNKSLSNRFKWKAMEEDLDKFNIFFSNFDPIENISNLTNQISQLRRLPLQTELVTYYNNHLAGHTEKNKKIFYIPIMRGFQHFEVDHILKKSTSFDTWVDQGVFPKSFSDIKKWRDYSLFDRADLYAQYTNDIYKSELSLPLIETYTGQGMYEAIKSDLLGTVDQRGRVVEFQEFLSKKFFENKQVLITPYEKKSVLRVKIGKVERDIYNLGDGIQTLITIFYKVFFEKNSIFLIEEPENTLHPSMQRRMIDTFYSKDIKEQNHQFFITTHSNHLMDLSLDHNDISIYKFNTLPDDRKLVEQVDSGNESVLFELGVNNSSVFIANSTIWVEGVTDRFYLKKILDLYLENEQPALYLKEDVDYAFVEYGGSNVTHFNFSDEEDGENIFVKRIAGKSLLIADTDWTGNKEHSLKKERLGNFKKVLGDRFIPIRGEIENILSSKSIFDGIKAFPVKSKDIDYIEIKKIASTAIGKLIDKNYFGGQKEYAKSKTNGSLGVDKKIFAKAVVENLTYEDLSPIAIKITERMIDHIKKNKIK